MIQKGFAAIVEALSGTRGVTPGSGGRGFGSDALQIDGRILPWQVRRHPADGS